MTKATNTDAISRTRTPICAAHPFRLVVPTGFGMEILTRGIPRASRKSPEPFGKIPERSDGRGNHGFDGDTCLAGRHGERSAQRQEPLPHSDQAEAELLVRLQPATVVANPDHCVVAVPL